MTILKALIFFTIVTIIINFFPVRSNFKILYNLILNVTLIFYLAVNIDELVIYIFIYLSYLYIILNIYTTKYSSIRLKIMEGIENKKQYSDLKLFDDRKKRFQRSFKKKDPIMRPILFIILIKVVNFFRFLLT